MSRLSKNLKIFVLNGIETEHPEIFKSKIIFLKFFSKFNFNGTYIELILK